MKKVRVIHRLGLFVLVLLPATSGRADVTADLKQAEGFYKAGQYAQAEQAYRSILQEAANDPEAVYQAGKMLPQVYLATDRLEEAQAATQQLLTRSAGNEWLPHAVHEIIEQGKTLNRTSQAKQILQNILTSQSEHPQALWLKMGVAIAEVYGGNQQAVDAGVQDLVTHDSADRWAGEALAQIGWAFDKLGQCDKSRPLYEYVVDHWPDKPRAIYAHTALVRDCTRLNDKQAAQARLQQLISRYAQDAHLPNVLNEIARGYREAQMYQEAQPVSQYVLDRYPDNEQRIWARRDLVLCDVGLNNPQNVQAGVQQLVADRAKDARLPYVLNEIARICREARMYEPAKPVSQYILDHYPDNEQRIWALRDLVLCDVGLSNPQGVQAGVQRLVADRAKDTRLPYVLNETARICREARMYEQAKPISQYVLDHYPDGDQRLWAQRDLILCEAGLGNREAAQAGMQRLVTDYTKDGNLPYALNDIARIYREARMYEPAKPISQYVLDHYPNTEHCLWADRDILLCDVRLHNQDAVQTALQNLVNRHAQDRDLPFVLLEVSGQCRQMRMYGQARSAAQYVLDHYPDSDRCLWAHRDVVLSYLGLRDIESADAESQKLMSRFASRADAFWAASDIAEANRRLGRHQQARDLLRFNVTNYPASDDMIWSLRNFVNESIALSDDAGIDAGIKKLLSEYATSKDLPMVLVHVGRTLCNAGRSQAAELFQYVMDKHPSNEQALLARVCMGHVYLQQGQDQQAEALYQKVLTDYFNHPKLAEAINLMAEGYFDRGVALERAEAARLGSAQYAKVVWEQGRSEMVKDCYHRAIEKWQIIIQKMPLSDQTARAWYFTGVAYRRHLGEPEKAVPYYEKVVETWPDYEYAWSAQQMLAVCYETLVRSGKMTKEVAQPKLEAAYKGVLEKYSDISLAEQAYLKLGILKLNNGEPAQAATYFQQFLQRYPQAKQWPHALILLGMTYDRQGMPEIAAELYRSYLDTANPDDPRIKLLQARLDKEQEVQK